MESDVHDNGTAIKLSLAGSLLLIIHMVLILLAAHETTLPSSLDSLSANATDDVFSDGGSS